MKKDRVVLKDYIFSVLSAGGVGIAVMLVFIPIILAIISRTTGEELPLFLFSMAGTVESVGCVIAITHIVLGALVLQYMRLYMFTGFTRSRAFFRVMAVEGITIAVSFVFLFALGSFISLISPDVDFSYAAVTCVKMSAAFVMLFGIGCISSALSTLCRPPLSVALVTVVLFAFLWAAERLSAMSKKVLSDVEGIHIIIESLFEGQEALISLGAGIVMCICAYFIYRLKISQIKSTSIS